MLWSVFQPTVGHCVRTMSENSYRYVTVFSLLYVLEKLESMISSFLIIVGLSALNLVLLWCQMAGWCVLYNLDKCSLFKCKLGECVDGKLICLISRWWQPSCLICEVFSKWKIHSSCDTGQVSELIPLVTV